MNFFQRPLWHSFICPSCIQRLLSRSLWHTRGKALIKAQDGFRSLFIKSASFRPSLRGSNLTIAQARCSRNNRYSTSPSKKPLRIAVIGSGPAGFYTAYRLMKKIPDAVVDMYEQFPVPYGLVRFGVAPDHPEVKNCQGKFEEVAESARFNYIGNVRVGYDVELVKMKPHYDAILFSYGASEDRKLGIPGEDLPGVLSARAFVGWYNGLPQFQDLTPELEAGDQAVIIGQGNVALDVARILLTPVDELRKTDITEQALEFLSRSKARSVKLVGRRGPLQAAFTVKEVRELMNIPSVAFESIDTSLFPHDTNKLPRVQKRIAQVLNKGSASPLSSSPKSWGLSFLLAPKSMNTSTDSKRISSVDFTNQAFALNTDPFSKTASVVPTGEITTIPASLAFRSVGYKSAALPGLSDIGAPFDAKLGIILNDPYGRVMTPSGGPGNLAARHIPGLYCAGWVKRGPTGVIASTMDDAFISADIIARDWEQRVPFLNVEKGQNTSTGLGWDGVKGSLIGSGVRPLDWNDWKKIDAAEKERGRMIGKEREKFGTVAEMLNVLDR
ncbi:NADPH:adrenodoxin oxidoreductase mitochondrial precursor [Lindgomyces ingoldianus]|uniref:NADPH:adrenodoxin oxidoreductase mitochondrial n=1 Tax=Lindgomyces ingoldianus TaxID=673940 RepID=A0ACB6R1H5_9PLEO|nr:NADPH:adrenodoxin oxidoreductase mitochondrial precursor [Lindgomyces ingoldianus]KAF2472892.1 NADPH:adrenodoxin oxidoreductase mitochondrial precursor [Lindgomyces ingoldianus]